jgi:predicted dehydrogenase
MAINVTPEERQVGQENFHRVVGQLAESSQQGVTRRQFMKGLVAAGMVAPVSAAAYFGYNYNFGSGGNPAQPIKAALIGSGDEGGVLVGEHNPEFLEFVAICDARPTNQKRIFTGDVDDKGKLKPTSPRKGFNNIPHYGKDAKAKIKVFSAIDELFNDKSVQFDAVVIALPLHLHAPVAIAAMRAGKHVLCEKLMAWNIKECKRMIKVAQETDRILAIGHQRHYSMLYAHAVEVLQSGILGDVTHIRALWHRNNAKLRPDNKTLQDGWKPDVAKADREKLESIFKDLYPEGYKSLEEMVRWRIHDRTGGGLMAELGSHQLDACSIFLDAMARAGASDMDQGPHRDTVGSMREKVHPLAVSGVGMRTPLFVGEGWECDDQVFCSFEFPGKKYWADWKTGKVNKADDRVMVTYSSINTNGFEPYGECVMGSRGTMVVEIEQSIMLYPEPGSRATSVGVKTAEGGKPALDTSGSTGGPSAALDAGQKALGAGKPSRGYREEMEDFAYCIRMWDQMDKNARPLPRCHGRVAMGDAIIALTANQAMAKHQRIEFRPEWFDPTSDEVPDADRVLETVKGKRFAAELY